MSSPKLQLLHRTLQRLMRRGATGPLQKVLAKSHAADLAFLLRGFTPQERQYLVAHLANDEQRAAVFGMAEGAVAAEILAEMPRRRAVELLHLMEPDDVSGILRHMEQTVADELLTQMQAAARSTVEDLSRYDHATAGGIMSPRYFALHREVTVREAIASLQPISDELEMVFYIYVVNELHQLLGVVSLRQLVTTRPDARLFDIMTSDVISVRPDVDQEEVARLAARYGLLAIPVVDDANKLLGIVTVDDVIDVLQEEANEDILRMAGAGNEVLAEETFGASLVRRMPWILGAGLGGVVAAVLLFSYLRDLGPGWPLLIFVPLILGMSGVMGAQSAAVITMKLVIGQLGERGWAQVLRHIGLGLIFGVLAAVLLGCGVGLWLHLRGFGEMTVPTATMVGLATAAALVPAAAFGALLPLLFRRLNIDPALATGPAVAIGVDLIALLAYLSVGSLWL